MTSFTIGPHRAAVRQDFPQPQQRPAVAPAGRGGVDPEHLGRLLVGQRLQVAQNKDLLIDFGQPGDGLPHPARPLAVEQVLAGRGAGGQQLVGE
jgi:hypothetical protein